MKKITVNASGSYDIILGENLLIKSGNLIRPLTKAVKAVIVTDNIVDMLYSSVVSESLINAGFEVTKFVFLNGESSKSHSTLLKLYDFLAENEITRSDIIVALGGGVVGDLAGFCAATFLRGIDYVQIPTTLLAQVDSSIGGKTAVDIPAGKNLVGAFKQPLIVIADTKTLDTLSDDIFSDGMGEVVKYGMIRSKALFNLLSEGDVKDHITDIIAECIDIKRRVVENDEYDNGERMILNFGHTIGHAIEKHHLFKTISHGKAVAIGMYMITRLSEEKGLCESGTAASLLNCLDINGLPHDDSIAPDEIISYSGNDKKRSGSDVRIVICPSIGETRILTLTDEEYRDFIRK